MKKQNKISVHYRKHGDGTLADVIIVKWNYLANPNFKLFSKHGLPNTTNQQKSFQGQSVEEGGTP